MATQRTVNLKLPENPNLLAAAGAVALAHCQLELVFRMTVKSLANISVIEALDATNKLSSVELRRRIRRLLRQRVSDDVVRLRMDALLERGARLTDRRNKLMHRPWAVDSNGHVVVKDQEHQWGEAPSPDSLKALAAEIGQLAEESNQARLEGFLKDALAGDQTA